VKGLEDDADVLAAEPRQTVLVELAELGAGHLHAAFGGALQPGEGHQQGGLAGARGTDDAQRFAGGDGQVDLPQDVDWSGAPH
jgi:hypothetical protein